MNLREKIARRANSAKYPSGAQVAWSLVTAEEKRNAYDAADEILAKVAKAVEKVENPYLQTQWRGHDAFEEARQAILKAIEGE